MVRSKLITLDIFYFRPDYRHILQEFVWQTYDTSEYARARRFLLYWQKNISAVINQIYLAESDEEFKCAKFLLQL